MKRSKMLEILEQYLTEDRYSNHGISNHVLKLVEQAGMLPPDNGKEAYDVLDYRSKCLVWEPEDET